MTAHKLLNKAIILATEAHAGQTDKAGQPYILHPLRVMNRCQSVEAKIVAVLHDVVEDTDVTIEQLFDTFGETIGRAVDTLTKQPGDDYKSYIMDIWLDGGPISELAAEVKIADLRDNMDITRLKEVTSKDIERLNRYAWALAYLEGRT